MSTYHHHIPGVSHAPFRAPGSYQPRRPRSSSYRHRTVPTIGDHRIEDGIIEVFEGYTEDGCQQWRILGLMNDPDAVHEILTSDDL